MIRKAFKTCAAGFAAGLGLLGGALPAMAQTPPTTGVPGDWPNLGAFNNRQSRNVSPFAYNSGSNGFRYGYPATVQERNSLTLDNTDLPENQFSNGGPYADPADTAYTAVAPIVPRSFVQVSSHAAWPVPVLDNGSGGNTIASAPFLLYIRRLINPAPTGYTTDFRTRTTEYFNDAGNDPANQDAAYNYAYCVPSDPGGDGTTAANGVTASYFQWRFVPTAGDTRTYALYAYLPVGTTQARPQGGGVYAFLYPQRYFVYEIRFGPDRDGNGIPDNRIVDILDTEKVGNGYVRLGVTDNEANTYFPADGNTSNIQVRLYNTVPRDSMVPSLGQSTGKLLLPNAPAAGAITEATVAKSRLVYADAARIDPFTGTFAASPTTTTINGNTTNASITTVIDPGDPNRVPPIVPSTRPGTPDAGNQDPLADWNLTLARTNVAYNFTGTTVTNTSADGQGRTVNGTLQVGTDGVVINAQANPLLWPLQTNGSPSVEPYAKWRYSLSQSQVGTTTVDDTGATNGGFAAGTVNPNHVGSTYLTSGVDPNGTASVTYAPDLADGDYDVYAYIPGDYTAGPELYATALNYTIYQGTTPVYTGTIDESKPLGWFHLGGNARFANTQTALPNEPLTVVFFNKDTNAAADITAGRKAYADAVRFVGQANSGFDSTPVHATVAITPQGGGTPVDTKVVLVADNNGVIHCLDETGRGDGTTTEYWSYPSTPDATNASYKDPNIWDINGSGSGIDGVPNAASTTAPYDNTPTAVMPSGFNLSTATIARVPISTANGNTTYEDRLYIGATNGRVYCINMSGRGDYNVANRVVGSTQRRWTFPEDYDPSNPTAPRGTATLGAFSGSVLFGYPNEGVSTTPTPSDRPTVYVAANGGRVFSLSAIGDSTATQTTVQWRFPTAGQPTLPTISMTPTLFSPTGGTTNRLLFGTQLDATNDGPGQFYCLNATDGAKVWAYNDATANTIANPDVRVTNTGLDGFVAGPVAVDAGTLGQRRSTITIASGALPTLYDTVYVLNQNGYLFGLNVADGTLVSDDTAGGGKGSGTHVYITDSLTALTSRTLTFTFASDYIRGATFGDTFQTVPMIEIPGDNGTICQLFARPEDYSEFTDTTVTTDFPTASYDYHSVDPTTGNDDIPSALASLAASNNYLFSNDEAGHLTAYDGSGIFSNFNPAVDYGIRRGVSPNDPRADAFRRLRVRLINAKGYNELRKVNTSGTNEGLYSYATTETNTFPGTSLSPANAGVWSKNYGTTSLANGASPNPYGFEWGETAYILAYNFPYADQQIDGNTGAPNGTPVEPPTITVQISVEGRIVRAPTALARKFPGTSPSFGTSNTSLNGYAVLSYAFNSSGASALAPGTGRLTASISTSAITGSPASIPQSRRGDSAGNYSTLYFVIANPLAIAVYDPSNGAYADSIGVGTNNVFLTNGAAPENSVNGTPAIGAQGTYTAEPLKSQLHASAPLANHGSSTTARVSVYDRSLTALLHEDGLSNFRVTRSNLQRQGGYGAVYSRFNLATPTNPVDPTANKSIYPGFEDRPTVDGTNTSLDYPDMGREQVRALLAASGAAENPVTVASTLLPPKVRLSDGTTPLLNANNYDQGTRQPTPTPLDLTIDVPRYQPPVAVENMPGYVTTNTAVTTPDAVRDLLDVRHDSLGYQIPVQGYFGRVSAFIDSNNDNKLTQDTTKEVYRAFNFSTNVLPQYSVLVGSPTVDLGSLASGTGYAPAPPATLVTSTSALDGGSGPFSPWNTVAGAYNWAPAYRTVIVRNDSNLNLLDVRLAKGTSNNGGAAVPWALPTADNDPLAWMTASLRGGITGVLPNDGLNAGDLWSNFDSTYAARNGFNNNSNLVILPKSRVTDRVPSELKANPYPRANPNLALRPDGNEVPKGTAGSRLVDGNATTKVGATTYPNTLDHTVPTSAPKIAVSVPMGFPVGSYSAQVRVVENIIPFGTPADNDILESLGQASEAYSDPLTLTYKVRETRMTNGPTPRTAAVVDPLVLNPNYTAGSTLPQLVPTRYRNSNPTAMRETGGALDVVWESDRGTPGTALATLGVPNPSQIYFGRMVSNGVNSGQTGYNPPLWDLSQFTGTPANQWFTTSAGFPGTGQANGLFGGTTVGETVTYGSPSLPARGQINPLSSRNGTPSAFGGGIDLGFVGDAQIQTATGRISASKVFLTTVTPSQNGGLVPDAMNIRDMGGDPQTKKGKPSVVQLSTGPLVFFSETSAGQSGITASRLVGNTAVTVPLGFGDGFSSVFSPSANARPYVGADATLNAANKRAIVDLSFAGKLRGRANAEVYLGRLRLNTDTGGLVDGGGLAAEAKNAGSPFVLLPQQSSERVVGEANGTYRTRGVDWDPTRQVLVRQWIGGNYTDLLVAGTGAVDRQSGIASYDSRLGGKVYIDAQLGTIRFASAFPNRNADIRVTYTPYFLRVTPGGTAGYSAVNGLWDDRYALDNDFDANGNAVVVAPGYWFAADQQQHLQSPGDPTIRGLRNDRYFFAYGRGAAGGGVTARPYTTTMRLGVRLPTRIATDNQGRIIDIRVQGNTMPYQVDPANGRVYLMAEDEDRPITVTYRGVDESTNLPTGQITVGPNTNPVYASFVLEKTETPVAVDEAANETALSAFVDPLTSTSLPRPALYWLFYVSTRAGGPDLYFQSIAPRYTPFAK